MDAAESFARDGFFVARGVYAPDQIQALEREFDRIVATLLASGEDVNARWDVGGVQALDGGDSVVLHTHNVQQFSAQWLQAFLDPALLDVAEAILGPDVVLHHSKLFQKPPERGSPFPMHQDWSYFPTELDSMIAAVIHVSEADDAMGCLRVVPSSHRLGRLEGSSGARELEGMSLETAVPVEAQPGDVLFFHYLTVHGSMPNRSARTRKTVLVQMHAGDDAVEEGCGHPNGRLVLRGFNHRASRAAAGAMK